MNQLERIRLYRLNNCVDHVFAYYRELDKIQAIREREQENTYLDELEQFEQDFEYSLACHNDTNNPYKLFK